jgi:phosphonoacetaldehyde hydrolase
MYTRRYTGKIQMVILDTAGTVCDGPQDLRNRWPQDDLRGCKAPIVPFYNVFKNHDITVDWSVIREPMGMYKPDQLRYLLELPEIQSQYVERYGHNYNEEEFAQLLDEFKTLLPKYTLDDDLAKPIDGALECIEKLREAEIYIGCDTGYFDDVSRLLNHRLEEVYGLYFDVSSNSETVQGRPSPCMIFDCMSRAKIWPAEAVAKVDDTAAGILSGNNAGCWTVGLYASGNDSYEKLAQAKPDYLLPSIKYLAELIFCKIEPRVRRGERPGQ